MRDERIITSPIRAGQEPDERERERIAAELAEARKRPVLYDEDSPRLTPEQLAQFAPVNGLTQEERSCRVAQSAHEGNAPGTAHVQ
jgi:hypothetical protein